MMLAPISLFVAFLALMAKWLLTLSSYVVAPLMLYIFGCGIYTVYRQTWDQFLILLVAEFLCFALFLSAQLRWWRTLNDSAVGFGILFNFESSAAFGRLFHLGGDLLWLLLV